MDATTIKMIQDLIGAVGVPSAIVISGILLAWKALPQSLGLFTRGIAAMERIAETMAQLAERVKRLETIEETMRELKDIAHETLSEVRKK